ncbi:hypothetical protein LTS18_005771 [Coniosporium uncinatum]|uniref:Uncharacterized protein n=1 Tax=Coniosporium uncinatum TaxID=93489 RepID=A0ACC3DAV2_9PEZI|nr:hypothetical protein LTS18_005771 [Coniosporium uncinatum]
MVLRPYFESPSDSPTKDTILSRFRNLAPNRHPKLIQSFDSRTPPATRPEVSYSAAQADLATPGLPAARTELNPLDLQAHVIDTEIRNKGTLPITKRRANSIALLSRLKGRLLHVSEQASTDEAGRPELHRSRRKLRKKSKDSNRRPSLDDVKPASPAKQPPNTAESQAVCEVIDNAQTTLIPAQSLQGEPALNAGVDRSLLQSIKKFLKRYGNHGSRQSPADISPPSALPVVAVPPAVGVSIPNGTFSESLLPSMTCLPQKISPLSATPSTQRKDIIPKSSKTSDLALCQKLDKVFWRRYEEDSSDLASYLGLGTLNSELFRPREHFVRRPCGAEPDFQPVIDAEEDDESTHTVIVHRDRRRVQIANSDDSAVVATATTGVEILSLQQCSLQMIPTSAEAVRCEILMIPP